MQSSKMSLVVKPTHRRQLVKLLVCLEKVQLAIAQYRSTRKGTRLLGKF